jgi:hypothetical protein
VLARDYFSDSAPHDPGNGRWHRIRLWEIGDIVKVVEEWETQRKLDK